MIGKYTLEVSYKKVKYKIEINRSVTVIKGDSGTGKSTLVDLVDKAIQPNSLIKCNLREIIYALNNNSDWEYLLTKLKNKIIFIDESCYFINRKEFVELAQNSDNYFVLITRLNLSNWVYSYKSIYELETIGKESSCETVLKSNIIKI